MPGKKRLPPPAEVIVECAADIPMKNPQWLLYHWLARGVLTLLAGMPGAGKTGIALEIAACVSNGGTHRGQWAGGLMAPYGSVVILTYEDLIDATIIPRLVANGADLSKIHILTGSRQHDGHERPFDFGSDLRGLVKKIEELNDVALVIIDPVISVVTGDAHKNQDVRTSFAPLVALADSMQFSILGITHFNKGSSKKSPLDRLTGSGAFGQQARGVVVAAKIDGEKDASGRTQGILVRAKLLGPEGDGFLYSINPTTVRGDNNELVETAGIVWQDQPLMEGNARELIAWAENGGISDVSDTKKGQQAEDFVLQMLADGPIPTLMLNEEAAKEGISQITLTRARRALKVVSTKMSDHDGHMRTMLSLPHKSGEKRYSRDSGMDFRQQVATQSYRTKPIEERRRENDDQLDQVDQVDSVSDRAAQEDFQLLVAAGHDLDQDLDQAVEPDDDYIWTESSRLVRL